MRTKKQFATSTLKKVSTARISKSFCKLWYMLDVSWATADRHIWISNKKRQSIMSSSSIGTVFFSWQTYLNVYLSCISTTSRAALGSVGPVQHHCWAKRLHREGGWWLIPISSGLHFKTCFWNNNDLCLVQKHATSKDLRLCWKHQGLKARQPGSCTNYARQWTWWVQWVPCYYNPPVQTCMSRNLLSKSAWKTNSIKHNTDSETSA